MRNAAGDQLSTRPNESREAVAMEQDLPTLRGQTTAAALTIAGSDPSGGAGLQADLKTFQRFGVYGMSTVTLLTVQNTQRVQAVEFLDRDFVSAQLDAVLEDIQPTAAKAGALGNATIIEAVAERASGFSFPFVVDPVMVSKHGGTLLDAHAVQVLKERLLPHSTLITPNLPEAARLVGFDVRDIASMEAAAVAISRIGVPNVLIKGGRLDGAAMDLLFTEGRVLRLPGIRIETLNTHGSGCVLSAAITAGLAMGNDVVTAVQAAKRFVTAAISPSQKLGRGRGPLDLFVEIESE